MRLRLTPVAYRVVTSLMTPVLPLLLRIRARNGKEDPTRIRERMARTDKERPHGTLIWLHGASVGETQMIRPVIDRLLENPKRSVLVTSGTVTAAKLLAEQLPDRAIHQYAPLDTPRATARFMAHWRPDLAVFIESELWPNLIWTARRANVPLALINGRMSERSLRRWAKRPKLAKSVIGAFNTILAADERTAEQLGQILIRDIQNSGNLKLDAPPLPFDRTEHARLKALIGDRPVWLAASTHAQEEPIIAALHNALPDAFLIWLPRHPERAHPIAQRTDGPLRSEGQDPTDRLYIMDTLGEMGLALSLADVCVLGGSFHPDLMGHNPLEAARAGVPVLTGPHLASFSDLYARMEEENAVTIVPHTDMLSALQTGLDGQLDRQAARASAMASRQNGTLDKTLEALEALL